jgi:hypothetical protein
MLKVFLRADYLGKNGFKYLGKFLMINYGYAKPYGYIAL